MVGGVKKGLCDEPVAVNTIFGWVLCSNYKKQCYRDTFSNIVDKHVLKASITIASDEVFQGNDFLEKSLSNFWIVDSVGTKEIIDDIYDQFEKDITFDGSSKIAV